MRKTRRASDYNPGGRPFTGRQFLTVILGFFGVIVCVNIVMAYFAVTNFRGVIVDSGYVASQHFNEDQARLEAQAARGWTIEAQAPGGAPLVAYRDAEGTPIRGLSVRAVAERPLDAREDREIALVEAGPGLYAAESALPPGRWRLQLVADGSGPRHASAVDLFIDPEG